MSLTTCPNVQEEATIIIPPDTTGDQFELNWTEIDSSVRAFPMEYLLKVQAQRKELTNEDDSDEPDIPLIPLVCHRVKVQRYEESLQVDEQCCLHKLFVTMVICSHH